LAGGSFSRADLLNIEWPGWGYYSEVNTIAFFIADASELQTMFY